MKERGHWGSRLGFVLAAAGSAVGLGNIWKFPYITGVNGGGAFVLVYLICVVVVGLPIMLAEFQIGAISQRNPVGAVRELEGKKWTPWLLFGGMGVLAAFVIMSFYSVVAGWSLAFVANSLSGYDVGSANGLFQTLTHNSGLQIFWHGIFMTMTGVVVAGGVNKGLERANDWLMPGLILLLLGMAVYATTLPGFGKGFAFLFHFDFGQLTPKGILSALGHAFFTLSLGMGAMITYGSYLKQSENNNLFSSALWILFLDTTIALTAGLVIFPIAFTAGFEPGQGPGLIFNTLPQAFAQLPGGMLLSTVFFLLLSFAAFTSALSLVEVAVSFVVDELGVARKTAAFLIAIALFLLGIPVVLSSSFFEAMDVLSANYLLPLGGMLIALYTGWKMDPDKRKQGWDTIPRWVYLTWVWLLRTVAPAMVGLIFLNTIFEWV